VGDDELPGAPGRHGCPRWPRRTRAEAATLPPPGIGAPNDADVAEFRRAQYRLWGGLRDQGNPWLITDFISVGTPMYFAHLLYTRDVKSFDERVKRRELPTCPPQNEERPPDEVSSTGTYFSYPWRGRQVLYDGATFAVVGWTNRGSPTCQIAWIPGRLVRRAAKGRSSERHPRCSRACAQRRTRRRHGPDGGAILPGRNDRRVGPGHGRGSAALGVDRAGVLRLTDEALGIPSSED
jgi:hypothetical protein